MFAATQLWPPTLRATPWTVSSSHTVQKMESLNSHGFIFSPCSSVPFFYFILTPLRSPDCLTTQHGPCSPAAVALASSLGNASEVSRPLPKSSQQLNKILRGLLSTDLKRTVLMLFRISHSLYSFPF